MAGLGKNVPAFDNLLASSQPRDTQVIILEENSFTEAADSDCDQQRTKPRPPGSCITLDAHWVVLFSLSPYFEAKVRAADTCYSSMHGSAAKRAP
jgi:hypothetical protein